MRNRMILSGNAGARTHAMAMALRGGMIVEFFLGLCEQIAGKEHARRFFPLVFTIFIFIVIANWMGILPGFGTVGRIAGPEEIAHHHDVHDYHDPALADSEHKTEDSKMEKHAKHHSDSHGGDHGAHLDSVKLHIFTDYQSMPIAALSPGSLNEQVTFAEYGEKHGDVGVGKRAGHLVPFLRSANTDLNMSLAIAIVAMVMVHFWGSWESYKFHF